MKSVALFDLDNTLYEGFSYFALLEKQVSEGFIRQSTLDEALEIIGKHKDGRSEYEVTVSQLLDVYAKGLEGKLYDEVYVSTLEFYMDNPKIYAYVKPLFALLDVTHDLYLVTGEPQFVAEAIAEIYTLEGYAGTEYEVKEGRFTGKIVSRLAFRHEKQQAIKRLLEGSTLLNSFAFGDSEGDIGMLNSVAYPICVNPNPGLTEQATKRGWACVAETQVEKTVREILVRLT